MDNYNTTLVELAARPLMPYDNDPDIVLSEAELRELAERLGVQFGENHHIAVSIRDGDPLVVDSRPDPHGGLTIQFTWDPDHIDHIEVDGLEWGVEPLADNRFRVYRPSV